MHTVTPAFSAAGMSCFSPFAQFSSPSSSPSPSRLPEKQITFGHFSAATSAMRSSYAGISQLWLSTRFQPFGMPPGPA